MSFEHFDYAIKIIIIGDISVGKTSLLNNFLKLENPMNTVATIGTEFKTFLETIGENTVKINFWDTSGQERYRSITT